MKIIGLRIEKYIDKEVSGHNCDFEYKDTQFEKHIICGVLDDNRKVEIELSRSEGECGSGWTTASWGHIKVTQVKKFNGYNHIPFSPVLTVEDIQPGFEETISNKVFSVDIDGGDSYYPSGGYSVKMEYFKPTSRAKQLRPVWIFKGKSNSGKTFLASRLNELEVYETDSNEKLPNKITASVIVIGNKYNFSIKQIKDRIIGKAEIHIVEFN